MDAVRRRRDGPAAALAAIAGVGGSYAVAGWTERFVVVPIDEFVIAATPGPIVTRTILALGERGHLLHQSLSIAIAIAALAACVTVGRAIGRRLERSVFGTGIAVGLAGAVVFALTASLASAIGASIPIGIVLAGSAITVDTAPPDRTRRAVLELGVFVGAFLGLSIVAGRRSDSPPEPDPLPDRAAHEAALETAADRSLDVDGLDGLVTPIGEFYTVDTASSPPRLDADGWGLRITGAVEQELAIDYDDLTARDPERRFVTLRCVSDDLNGGYADTALWTGVPIAEFVEEAGPGGGCECVMLRAADGYYERFPLEALRRTFLAYGMNGRRLPPEHGAPVRALVPGHWGEINVKWLTEVEILEEKVEGYWEERGWHGTGPVKTVAKLSAQNRLDDGRVELAGHAYAGTRGVSGVEVSTDGGESWADADLSEPLPGDDVWRQWRYAFEPSGRHEVFVRAIEDDGTVQPREETDPFPSGPSGWVRTRISE